MTIETNMSYVQSFLFYLGPENRICKTLHYRKHVEKTNCFRKLLKSLLQRFTDGAKRGVTNLKRLACVITFSSKGRIRPKKYKKCLNHHHPVFCC